MEHKTAPLQAKNIKLELKPKGLLDLEEKLKVLNWEQKVEDISLYTQLRPESLLDIRSALPNSSEAHNDGCDSVLSLLKKVNINEDSWLTLVEAYLIREKYGLREETEEKTVSLYNEVKEKLGREALNNQEVMATLIEIEKEKEKAYSEDLKSELSEGKRKIEALKGDIEIVEKRQKETESKLSLVVEEKSKLEDELKKLKEDLSSKLNENEDLDLERTSLSRKLLTMQEIINQKDKEFKELLLEKDNLQKEKEISESGVDKLMERVAEISFLEGEIEDLKKEKESIFTQFQSSQRLVEKLKQQLKDGGIIKEDEKTVLELEMKLKEIEQKNSEQRILLKRYNLKLKDLTEQNSKVKRILSFKNKKLEKLNNHLTIASLVSGVSLGLLLLIFMF